MWMGLKKIFFLVSALGVMGFVLWVLSSPSRMHFFDSGDRGNALSGYAMFGGSVDQFSGLSVASYDDFFDPFTIHDISLTIEQEEWDSLLMGMQTYYDTFGNYRIGQDVRASLRYVLQGETYVFDVGLRTKGNGTRDFPIDGDGNIKRVDYAIDLLGSMIGDVSTLLLESNRDDVSQSVQSYSHYILRSVHPYVARTTSAHIYITIGDVTYDQGIYTIIEPFDSQWVDRNFAPQTQVYKAASGRFGVATLEPLDSIWHVGVGDWRSNYRPLYELKNSKKEVDHARLLAFIDNINFLSGSAFEDYIDTFFDWRVFLDSMAVNSFLANPDDYRGMGNNYYLAITSTGFVTHIPVDLDNGLGQGVMGSASWVADLDPYVRHDTLLSQQGKSSILVDKLLAIDRYRDYYTESMMRLFAAGSVSVASYDMFVENLSRSDVDGALGSMDYESVRLFIAQRRNVVKEAIAGFYYNIVE